MGKFPPSLPPSHARIYARVRGWVWFDRVYVCMSSVLWRGTAECTDMVSEWGRGLSHDKVIEVGFPTQEGCISNKGRFQAWKKVFNCYPKANDIHHSSLARHVGLMCSIFLTARHLCLSARNSASLVTQQQHHYHMCYDEIGVCAHNINFILGSIIQIFMKTCHYLRKFMSPP